MKSSTAELVRRYRWDDMQGEQLKKGLTRKLITGDRMMIAHVYFESREEVPRHSHDNEQVTSVRSGALRICLGAADEQEVTVRAGEVVIIPSNLPHRAVALELTVGVDIIVPSR